MNLIEAIKSGKPFRRSCGLKGSIWLRKATRGDFAEWTDLAPNSSNQIKFTPDEILADDWEIQEPSVTITRTQFFEAISAAYKENGNLYPPVHELVDALAQKLGLEEP